jgi:hypothetical protein
MRTDTERAERAIWKLEQGSYTVRREGAGYVVTGPDGVEITLDDLAALVALADTVYDRVWTGRKITPSA